MIREKIRYKERIIVVITDVDSGKKRVIDTGAFWYKLKAFILKPLR